MMYFKNAVTGEIYGYDEKQQRFRINEAISAGWIDITTEVMSRPVPSELSAEQQNAGIYLKNTDWYVTRMMETGKPIPDDVLQKRQEARALLN